MRTRLFSPLQVGPVTLPNRIHVPPMCQWEATTEGLPTDYTLMHYAMLAASGAGSVTIEATGVLPEGRISPNDLGLWSDETEEGIARVVEAMRRAAPGVKVFIQLAHAGRKASCLRAEEWVSPKKGGWMPVAPSPLRHQASSPVPHVLTEPEIGERIEAFGLAAERAVRAGVDGIEIHAAHGYLIHEFLSPLSNTRTDAWGGPLENRMRFGLKVFESVRRHTEGASDRVAVGLRVSATDWMPGGWNPEETAAFIRAANAKAPVDFVDVSTGGLLATPIPVAPGYQVPFAREVRVRTGVPVFAVGLITNAFQAETILQADLADAVDIGRAVLADRSWGWRARRDLGEKEGPVPFNASFALR